MTVRIHTTLPGVNQEQFDAMHKLITAGEPPKGLLFHSSAPVEGQDYDTAMVGVQQSMEAAGVTPQGPPSVEEFPVNETFQP